MGTSRYHTKERWSRSSNRARVVDATVAQQNKKLQIQWIDDNRWCLSALETCCPVSFERRHSVMAMMAVSVSAFVWACEHVRACKLSSVLDLSIEDMLDTSLFCPHFVLTIRCWICVRISCPSALQQFPIAVGTQANSLTQDIMFNMVVRAVQRPTRRYISIPHI